MEERAIQHTMWMADINRCMIWELVAIFTTTLSFVLLEDHKLFFALGYYDSSGAPVEIAGGLLLVQLLVELFTEWIVDTGATFIEHERGIPVLKGRL